MPVKNKPLYLNLSNFCVQAPHLKTELPGCTKR